jgi:hypothetical protein
MGNETQLISLVSTGAAVWPFLQPLLFWKGDTANLEITAKNSWTRNYGEFEDSNTNYRELLLHLQA